MSFCSTNSATGRICYKMCHWFSLSLVQKNNNLTYLKWNTRWGTTCRTRRWPIDERKLCYLTYDWFFQWLSSSFTYPLFTSCITFSMISPWGSPSEQRFLSSPWRVWDQLPCNTPFFIDRKSINFKMKLPYSTYHQLTNINRYQLTNTHRLTWIDRMITDNRFMSIDYASKTETGAEKRVRIWKSFLTD